jgi:hypothetical protein
METPKLDNRMVEGRPAPDVQDHVRAIGPHEHAWVFQGTGKEGGQYQVCDRCNTRRVVGVPFGKASHKAWLEGRGEWPAQKEGAAATSTQIKDERKAAKVEAKEIKAEAKAEAKAAKVDTVDEVVEPALDPEPMDPSAAEVTLRRGPGRPRKL